jgi:hypothetical protein
MTLKQKFSRILPWYSEKDNQNKSNECEQIAEQFAIEFSEWLSMFTQEFEDGDLRYWNKDKWELKSMKELLEIFKKEKGL